MPYKARAKNQKGVVAHESATSILTRSIAAERIRKVRDLIREARRQLPHTVPGAVFINVVASAQAVQKAQEILSQQALANLFMIAFCSGRVVERIVKHQGGAFDAGLFEASDGLYAYLIVTTQALEVDSTCLVV